MSNLTSNQDLGERIEQLVQEHIAACRRAAQDAVARAFAAAGSRPARARAPRQVKSGRRGKRPAEEIAALSERLYQVVCAKPGETMMVLRADVGASARDLHRPMALLKRTGRVRTVGARHLTRYFPMMSDTTASG